MSKSVLMSLSPYWYYLIGEGIKTEEVRKTIPRALDWDKQVECYMTKDEKSFKCIPKEFQEKYWAHFGKVGMRFTCDRSDEFVYSGGGFLVCGDIPTTIGCLKQTCLTDTEFRAYAKEMNCHGWHISDLVIYDKPRELGEFSTTGHCFNIKNVECTENIWGDYIFHYSQNSLCRACKWLDDLGNCRKRRHTLTRPFQSWGYVEV